MQQNVIACRDFGVDAVLAVDGPRDQIQIVLSVIALSWGKERAVQVVAVVVDGAASAVAPCEFDSSRLQLAHVRLVEGILVAPDDHTRIIQPQHENVMVAKVVVLVDPVLEGEVGEDIVGLRDEHRFANRLLVLGT